MPEIHKTKVYLSHGADGEWFIVEPRVGHFAISAPGTAISPMMAVRSLLDAGRTVYELDAETFHRCGVKHRLGPRLTMARYLHRA